ncbi:hypothetical protein ACHAW6_000147 [Cyclotella cf. meneghiniana]
MAVVYVDDILFYSNSVDKIDDLIHKLQSARISIHHEGTAEGFLGVDFTRTTTLAIHQITLYQPGLAKRVVKAVGLCSSNSTAISTPAETSPLPKDAEGAPASGAFYAAVVGMLLYLSGHSRPNIAFAVHQCAGYTF